MTYIVWVRHADDDSSVYGVFGTEDSAARKAEAINKRLSAKQDEEGIAWAYVMPLHSAVNSADVIVREALR